MTPMQYIPLIAAAFERGEFSYIIITTKARRASLQHGVSNAAHRNGYAWQVLDYKARGGNAILVKLQKPKNPMA